MLVQWLYLIGHNGVKEDAEDATDNEFLVLITNHILTGLPHIVSKKRGVDGGRDQPNFIKHDEDEETNCDSDDHGVVDWDVRAIVVDPSEVVETNCRDTGTDEPGCSVGATDKAAEDAEGE